MIFETLRHQVPIDRIVSVNGSGKVRCVSPDHPDNDPSMHLYDDHVHCYVCGFHGDVVDVWGAQRGIHGSIEAALDLAREFAVKLPETSEEGRKKAQERREKPQDYLRLARVCHAALEKHEAVRGWWEGRGFGADLQQQFLLGVNRDGTEAVIPFWNRGRVQGLIRRKLDGEPKYLYPSTEEFVDGYRPLFVPGSARGEVFLVEGIIDALAIVAAGRAAVAVGGTNISEDQAQDLQRLLPKNGRLFVLPDDDECGEGAVRDWARRLYPKAEICRPDYKGGKDAADLFADVGVDETREHLGKLAATSEDLMEIETATAAKLDSPRRMFDYAAEHIVPLAVRIRSESGRDAALGIVAGRLSGVNASWLKKAVGEEIERLEGELLTQFMEAGKQEQERQLEEHRQKVEDSQEDIVKLFGPGVLGRLRKKSAAIHNVRKDERSLELALLIALGAQLSPLPNGRPLGASMPITADAGRGKNHLVDAAVELLPPEFYLAFEIASGQSLYYAAAEDPGFLKHKFVYPNEIEGVDTLVEFLRPMLSKGSARKFVTNKDSKGRNVIQEIVVEGPVTTAIPTIRNKTDEQLQTRLLVAELPDYAGRVKEHSQAVSELLRPEYTIADNSDSLFLWREGLRQLATRRRVVFPLDHPDFALNDDKISHGARLWANLLGLMAAHAWLEQRNRKVVELSTGEEAITATPDDYGAAYEVFKDTCQRTVVNLSDTHRAILDALHELQKHDSGADGFPQRPIAEQAGIKQGTVSKHKAFLTMSAKLIKETDHGLALVSGAEPSWWSGKEIMRGFPSPERVRAWWDEGNPPPDGSPRNHRNTGNQPPHEEERIADVPGENGHHNDPERAGIGRNRDSQVIPEGGITGNGLDKPKTGDASGAIPGIPVIPGSANASGGLNKPLSEDVQPGESAYLSELSACRTETLSVEAVADETRRSKSGPALALGTYLEKPNDERLEWLTKAVLQSRGMNAADWKHHAEAVKEAAEEQEREVLRSIWDET